MKRHLLAWITVAGLAPGCGQKKDAPDTGATNAASSGSNPISAPADYVGAVVNAQQHSLKVVDTVQVQQAIRQFQVSEERYPKDLEELVKEGYLPALPKLPARMKYQYDARTGQVRVVPAQ